jgi:outer membrane protein OmpA-like peptidoglycan-associated protein
VHKRKVYGARWRAGVVTCVLGIPFGAAAQGQSADVEFVRPSFGHGSFHAVDVPMVRAPLAFRYGALAQYQRDPLTLYHADSGQELGAVVTNRVNVSIGASMDLSERTAVSLLLPIAYNFGTEIPEFATDGAGLGDVGAGAKVIVLRTPRDRFNIGVRGGLILPTGRQSAWIGEAGVRARGGLLASLDLGPVRLATDAGLMTRQEIATDEDLRLGAELQWGHGLRVSMPDAARLAFTAQMVTRNGLGQFFDGGAANGIEAMGGVQVLPTGAVTLDLSAGRGFNEGYGTTDLRLLSQVTIQSVPKARAVQVEPIAPPPPPPVPETVPLPPAPLQIGPEPVSFTVDRIHIQDRIDFMVDTNILKESSRPVVAAVAELLNAQASIGHVVIEGHASEEGGFMYNYELSESRARRIWEELLKAGVAPSRVSYRSSGEVRPLEGHSGTSEADLDRNRRVEFHITRHYDDAAELPEYPATARLPWSGVEVPVVSPPLPGMDDAEPEPAVDEYGLPIDDEEAFEFIE